MLTNNSIDSRQLKLKLLRTRKVTFIRHVYAQTYKPNLTPGPQNNTAEMRRLLEVIGEAVMEKFLRHNMAQPPYGLPVMS